MDNLVSHHFFDSDAFALMTAASVFSMFFIIWALITIYQNKALTASVKFYLFSEHGLRLLYILVGYFWGTACIFWNADEVLPWVNTIFGFTFQALQIAVCFAQLLLSVNRFFAIAFDGIYYQKIFSITLLPQALFFVVLSVIPTTVTLIPGNKSYFDTTIYTFRLEDGALGTLFIIATQGVFAFFVWTTTIILDVFMLLKLHERRKNSASLSTVTNTEWRLALQMLVNHATNILNFIDGVLVFVFLTNDNDRFQTFLCSTLVLTTLTGFYGMNVVLFLNTRKNVRRQSVLPKPDYLH